MERDNHVHQGILKIKISKEKQNFCNFSIYFRVQRNGKHLNHSKISDWSLEGGFAHSKRKDTFPYRAPASGASSGLTVGIGIDNRYTGGICSLSIDGVKVSLILLL
jgi:hypothetical protein